MNTPELYRSAKRSVEEILGLEVKPESIDPATPDSEEMPKHRNWDHGSTQTTDDMYLGGLMCE